MRTAGLCASVLCALVSLALAAENAEGEPGPLTRLFASRKSLDLPDFPGVDGTDEDSAEVGRIERSPDAGEDYDNVEEDGPEGRHLHKIKRKLKPHKFGHHHHRPFSGNLYPAFGAYPGVGCRSLHGCGSHGWQRPPYGGGAGGPIAAAFAGPSYGNGWGGGWPGGRPQSQVATWNLGPFQGSFGYANAG